MHQQQSVNLCRQMHKIQKQIFFFSVWMVISAVAVMGQSSNAILKIALQESVFDFGKIPQGKPVFHSFVVKNTSAQNLQIADVQASCGCTTPEWKREIVAPGESTIIKVGYNAAAAGYFEKTITLFYGEGETSLITIKGDVWKTPEQPAPSNKSVAFLKQVNFNK